MTRDDESERIVERVSNRNYAADVNFSMQYTRWLLTLLGIWPDVISNSTKVERCVSRFLILIPMIVITMLLIPMASIPIVRGVTPTQFLILLMPFSGRSIAVMKNLILILRRNAIKSCIQHMENDWRRINNDNDREIMKKNLRVGHSLTIICVCCQYSGTIFYNIMPFLRAKKINELNETVRPITVPGIDIYVDLRAGHNYEIVIFSSCVSIFFVAAIIITICNLTAVLVCHACGQIQIVISRLESLVGNEDAENTDRVALQKGIAFIIQSHVRVLRFLSHREVLEILTYTHFWLGPYRQYIFKIARRKEKFCTENSVYRMLTSVLLNIAFASMIDELLRVLCLLEVFFTTLMLCLLGWLAITERKSAALVSYATLLVSYSFNIFIFCQIGELLKEKCQAVGKAAYMTEWYRLPGKMGLTLVMLISVAHYPRRLTAGRIVELSIMTFGNIMRTAAGYINMLRAITAE